MKELAWKAIPATLIEMIPTPLRTIDSMTSRPFYTVLSGTSRVFSNRASLRQRLRPALGSRPGPSGKANWPGSYATMALIRPGATIAVAHPYWYSSHRRHRTPVPSGRKQPSDGHPARCSTALVRLGASEACRRRWERPVSWWSQRRAGVPVRSRARRSPCFLIHPSCTRSISRPEKRPLDTAAVSVRESRPAGKSSAGGSSTVIWAAPASSTSEVEHQPTDRLSCGPVRTTIQ